MHKWSRNLLQITDVLLEIWKRVSGHLEVSALSVNIEGHETFSKCLETFSTSPETFSRCPETFSSGDRHSSRHLEKDFVHFCTDGPETFSRSPEEKSGKGFWRSGEGFRTFHAHG